MIIKNIMTTANKYENGVCNISKCKGQIPQNGWFYFKVKLFWATQNF